MASNKGKTSFTFKAALMHGLKAGKTGEIETWKGMGKNPGRLPGETRMPRKKV